MNAASKINLACADCRDTTPPFATSTLTASRCTCGVYATSSFASKALQTWAGIEQPLT